MSNLVAPVHTGCLYGKPLRFYRAPGQGTQLPWYAWEDPQAWLSLPPDLRAYFRQALMEEWAADVRTVATAEGIVIIAPQWMAQGVVGAIGEIQSTEVALTAAYQQQMIAAWKALTGDMPAAASMVLLAEAINRTLAEQQQRTTP